MKFTVEITDPAKLAGITAAREAHNATLPDGTDDDGKPIEPKPGAILSDEAYVQFVMDRAAESYAKQYGKA